MSEDMERADYQQQADEEKRRYDEAWEAHIRYCFGLMKSPARGYGPGHDYKVIYSGLNNEHVEQVRK